MKKNFITKIITILFIFSLANISNISYVYAGWFDKDIIKVSKCYDVKQFKSYREHKKKGRGFAWEADINLKDDTVYISVINDGKVTLAKAMINMKTDRFIGTYPEETYGSVFVFDMKKESVTSRMGINVSDEIAEILGGRETIQKCKFN